MTLENFRAVNLKIDRANGSFLSDQFAKAGDYNGRRLVVQLSNAGVVGDLTGVDVNLGWKHDAVKNTGLDPFETVDLSQGIFEIYYPKEMLNEGSVTAVIQIIEGDHVTETKNFKIKVEKSVIDEDTAVSENSFTVLEKALLTVNRYDSRISNVENSKVDKSTFEQSTNNLTAQLQQTEQSLNAQLAQTAKKEEVRYKSVPIGLDDASPDLLAAINGGEGATFNLLSEPRESSVTPNTIFGAKIGKNLFDKRRVILGKYFSHPSIDDRLGNYANGFTSGYINILPQSIYKISGARPNSNTHYAFYDADKTLISVSVGGINPTFTTPDNTVFLRFDGDKDYLNTIQLELGSVATPYEKFNYRIEGLKVSDPDVLDKLNSPTKPVDIQGYKAGKNLFNKDTILANHYFLNPTTSGNPTPVGTFSTTEYILAKPLQTYAASGGNTSSSRIAWVLYDENYAYISGGTFIGDGSFTTTDDTKYMRLDFRNTHINTFQIEEGGVVTPYSQYSYKLLGLEGSDAESYDQSLNTTDTVKFQSVTASAFLSDGVIPTGTLENPPEGLHSGDAWADTSDSVTHPIMRVML